MIYVKIANQSIVPQKSFLTEISTGPLSNGDGILNNIFNPVRHIDVVK